MANNTDAYKAVVTLLDTLGLAPQDVITLTADHDWLDIKVRATNGDFVEKHYRMQELEVSN